MKSKGTLHFFCGKMAAGKSTRALELVIKHDAILLAEDEWLKNLYPDEIRSFDDYIHYSARLKPLLLDLVSNLLNNNVSVVMDFPANTIKQRSWFKTLFTMNDSPHMLHYIEVDDALCLRQLKIRSVDLPVGAAFTSEDDFHQVNRYFQPPAEEEGFRVTVYKRDSG